MLIWTNLEAMVDSRLPYGLRSATAPLHNSVRNKDDDVQKLEDSFLDAPRLSWDVPHRC
jgi:hypothetical protein